MSFYTNKNGFTEIKDINEICKNLKDTVEYYRDLAENYRIKLKEFNKDEEIRKLQDELHNIYSHSL